MEKYNFVKHGIHPTQIEEDYLNTLFSRFVDVRNIIVSPNFDSDTSIYRLFQIKELFSIYVECIKYKPINDFINSGDFNLISHPFMMGLFKNLRHLLSHFPLAESWNDIKFKKSWLTAFDKKSQIEKFLTLYTGDCGILSLNTPYTLNPIKVVIGIPAQFNTDGFISLKEIINERDGSLIFALIISLILGKQIKDYDIPFENSKNSILVKDKSKP
ncbi:hypothetical protein AB6735_10415 [Mucilaginibacter sp. RCC_168]|jgi:hypothetical protein|uniref:hypothetical protein n=1 Tax=Mucilaginibacter sp. RCC_168 TaxID=3239221 RepID=UPI003524B55F